MKIKIKLSKNNNKRMYRIHKIQILKAYFAYSVDAQSYSGDGRMPKKK